ncbi:hypothetical protein FE257_008202 [Aspergillus nanangensis]|uniref:Cyclochlorotine biosynthesis protein O n=1 Tax=Aspergillus nanangensis TaxID=2582783 RepID=A0AAD4CM88_ASPNN|nr:hypothetical protein FE257_008202 [Aspergillus nanangensis]
MAQEQRPFLSSFPKHEEDETDDEPTQQFELPPFHRRKDFTLRLICIVEALGLLALSLAIVLIAQRKHSNLECTRQVSAYSPLLEEPDLVKYSDQDLPLYFNEKTEYRGPPTPEREILWETLWHQGAFEVPEDKLDIMNKSHTGRSYKHVPPEVGTGYAAQLGVLHQLHCVHMLRQWSYKEHWIDRGLDLPGSLYGDPRLTRMHLDHCIEVLRANIMCTSDVTPILIELDPSAPFGERADFRANHKCRNFWDIRQWVMDNTAIP